MYTNGWLLLKERGESILNYAVIYKTIYGVNEQEILSILLTNVIKEKE